MKTLYATDLDGTLLGADALLSDGAAALYRRLSDAGVALSFITARTPATVEPIMAEARPKLPGVVMTGAAIWNPQVRSYESVIYHRPEDVAAIAAICRDNGVNPFVYTLPKETHADAPANRLQVYHPGKILTPLEHSFVVERTINDLKTFHLHTPAPESSAESTVLFFAMGTPADIRRVAEGIREHTHCYASWYPDTYNPGVSLLEVFARGVSKAEGLAELKKRVGADRVVAFGDNLNDIPMLRAADTAVAVENAHPDVKEAADIVIGPNTADSVLRFIATREGISM